MAGKVKLTVTVEHDLAEELDIEAKSLNVSRSSLVEEGIKLLRKKRLEDSLKSGYQAMANENLLVAEETIRYGSGTPDEE